MNSKIVSYKVLAKSRNKERAKENEKRKAQIERINKMALPAEVRKLFGWNDDGTNDNKRITR